MENNSPSTCSLLAIKIELQGGTRYAAVGSPSLNASRALTSVTCCIDSSMGMMLSRPLSVGSLSHPSIGMALSMMNDQQACSHPLGRSWTDLHEKHN